MTRNDLRSQSLDLLRFPLAVVVITIHVMYPDAYAETETNPFLNGLVRLLAGMLWDQSVPVYFFISGYVFFLNITLTKDVYFRKLRNRLKSLFLPYFIWNGATILKLLLFALPCLSFLFNHQIGFADMDLSFRAILMSFWNGCEGIIPGSLSPTGEIYPQDSPMWFVRDLIIIVLCTPLINKILSGNRLVNKAYLIFLGAAWFVCGLYPLGHLNQLLTGFFFFSLGANMSILRKDMMLVLGKYFKPALLAFAVFSIVYAFFILDNPDVANAIKKLNQCAGLVVAYNISSLLITKNICRVSPLLSSSSFFIYASNLLILFEIKLIIIRLINPQTASIHLLCYILTIIVIVSTLLSVFYLLRRYSPRLLKVIAGRK